MELMFAISLFVIIIFLYFIAWYFERESKENLKLFMESCEKNRKLNHAIGCLLMDVNHNPEKIKDSLKTLHIEMFGSIEIEPFKGAYEKSVLKLGNRQHVAREIIDIIDDLYVEEHGFHELTEYGKGCNAMTRLIIKEITEEYKLEVNK